MVTPRSVLFCTRKNWKTGSLGAFVKDAVIELCFFIWTLPSLMNGGLFRKRTKNICISKARKEKFPNSLQSLSLKRIV